MKKKKLVIIILLISLIAFLGFSIDKKLVHKKNVAERIKSIPVFSFKTLSGEIFSQKSISKNQLKLFVYFNSECDFCHTEAKLISEHIEQLKSIQILFISYQEAHLINQFAELYNL